jgi:hypothetical protein
MSKRKKKVLKKSLRDSGIRRFEKLSRAWLYQGETSGWTQLADGYFMRLPTQTDL